MYDFKPSSNDCVSVTEDKKGNNPVRLELVEMEAALNAGHWVESDRDMQL